MAHGRVKCKCCRRFQAAAGTASDGDYVVPGGWYGGTQPLRDASGYYYSRLVDGSRPSDGVADALGGTAGRIAVADLSGAVWPNVLDLRMDSPNSQVLRGDLFSVSYWYHQVWSNGRRRVEHFAPRGIADLQPYIPTNGPAVSCRLDNPGHLSRMPRLLSATETN